MAAGVLHGGRGAAEVLHGSRGAAYVGGQREFHKEWERRLLTLACLVLWPTQTDCSGGNGQGMQLHARMHLLACNCMHCQCMHACNGDNGHRSLEVGDMRAERAAPHFADAMESDGRHRRRQRCRPSRCRGHGGGHAVPSCATTRGQACASCQAAASETRVSAPTSTAWEAPINSVLNGTRRGGSEEGVQAGGSKEREGGGPGGCGVRGARGAAAHEGQPEPNDRCRVPRHHSGRELKARVPTNARPTVRQGAAEQYAVWTHNSVLNIVQVLAILQRVYMYKKL
eukprot:362048-Chlamydomonas_euryale.AAC.2